MLCDVESHLSTRTERFKGHLDILGRTKGNQVTILVLVLDPQWAVISMGTTKADLLSNLVHKVTEFRGPRNLNNKDIVVEVNLNFDRWDEA